jgi:hypothetical protein
MTIQELMDKFRDIQMLLIDVEVADDFSKKTKESINRIIDDALLKYKIEKRLANVE